MTRTFAKPQVRLRRTLPIQFLSEPISVHLWPLPPLCVLCGSAVNLLFPPSCLRAFVPSCLCAYLPSCLSQRTKEARGRESPGFGYQENSWVRLRRALRHDYPDRPTDWNPWASSGRGCADDSRSGSLRPSGGVESTDNSIDVLPGGRRALTLITNDE